MVPCQEAHAVKAGRVHEVPMGFRSWWRAEGVRFGFGFQGAGFRASAGFQVSKAARLGALKEGWEAGKLGFRVRRSRA